MWLPGTGGLDVLLLSVPWFTGNGGNGAGMRDVLLLVLWFGLLGNGTGGLDVLLLVPGFRVYVSGTGRQDVLLLAPWFKG